MNMNDLIAQRRSVRKFTSQQLTEYQISEIVKSAFFTPSGRHLRPYDLIVITDKLISEKLSIAGEWIKFVKDAPLNIVIVGDENKSNLWIEDCSLVAGNIYIEATNQGLGACWAHVRDGKTPFGDNRENYIKNLLNIPYDRRILCIMSVGYPEVMPEPYTENEINYSKIHQQGW